MADFSEFVMNNSEFCVLVVVISYFGIIGIFGYLCSKYLDPDIEE